MDIQAQSADAPARILLIEHDAGVGSRPAPDGVAVHGLSEGIALLRAEGADCVLLDVAFSSNGLISALEEIQAAAPDAAIVALADWRDDEQAVKLIGHGAQDYLVKGDLTEGLLERRIRFAIARKRSEVRLVYQALHDPLTGLPNRALFLDRLGVALDRARRTGGAVAVLFVDLDNFKDVNDSMGHAAGDRLLSELAQRLRATLRPMDTVARFGGDEFTLLFEELAGDREVVLIAQRILDAAAMPVRLEQGLAEISISIGIAVVTDPAVAPETVIEEADAALYRAKELGGSRYELFDEASRRRAGQRLELEAALRLALERAELRVHYQPRISLNRRVRVTGFEALVRWEHPERGLICPGDFIPLAEDIGIVQPIGAFVVAEAVAQLARWRRSRPDVTVSVNVSARQLEDAGFATMLSHAIEAAGVAPDGLCVEVSEPAMIRNPDVISRSLGRLKAIGVRLAIDDYGTGSIMLANLRRLPVDVLKIDRSLITTLGTEPAESTVVGAIVSLGHALGLHVDAEGVETDRQLAELTAMGCDGAQGFLFSPAVPHDEAELLMSAG